MLGEVGIHDPSTPPRKTQWAGREAPGPRLGLILRVDGWRGQGLRSKPQGRTPGPARPLPTAVFIHWRVQGGGAGWPGPSFVDVPDLGEQRWQLLVLEPQGEDLLRVHGAERAQAHELHQHAGETQLVLRGDGRAWARVSPSAHQEGPSVGRARRDSVAPRAWTRPGSLWRGQGLEDTLSLRGC